MAVPDEIQARILAGERGEWEDRHVTPWRTGGPQNPDNPQGPAENQDREPREEREPRETAATEVPRQPAEAVGTPEDGIPEGAVPVEWSWLKGGSPYDVDKNKPTVYEKGGIQYYAPGSVPYENGFRNSNELKQAQLLGLNEGPHQGSRVDPGSFVVQYGDQWVRVSEDDLKRGKGTDTGRPFKGLVKKIQAGDYRVPVTAVSENGETAQLLLDPATAEKVSKLEGRELFDEMQRLGILPGDIVWTHKAKISREPGELSITERKFNRELAGQPEEIRQAYQERGLEGYAQAIEAWNDRIKDQRAKFEYDLALNAPQYLRRAYENDQGSFQAKLDAYNKAVLDYNKALAWLNDNFGIEPDFGGGINWQAAARNQGAGKYLETVLDPAELGELKTKTAELDKLDPYVTPGGYDIARYLRDNPGQKTENQLLYLDFTPEAIESAKAFNKAYLGTGSVPYAAQPDRDAFITSQLQAQGMTLDQAEIALMQQKAGAVSLEVQAAINEYDRQYAPSMDLQTYTERYLAERGSQANIEIIPYLAGRATGKITDQESQIISEAVKSYTDKYGTLATWGSTAGEYLPVVFTPARSLKPDVKLEDISRAEWMLAGAQLATAGTLAPLGTAGKLALNLAATGGFAAETAMEWENMDTAGRALAVTITMLSALPLLSAARQAIRARTDTLGTRGEAMLKAEAENTAAMVERIRQAYGPKAARVFQDMAEGQAEYAQALINYQKLTSSRLARTIGQRAISNALKKVQVKELQLQRLAEKYAASMEGQAGFDSPAVAELLNKNRIGRDIVKNTRAAVDDLVPSAAKVKQLKAELLKANINLREAQLKNPTDPGKWADLVLDQAVAEQRLTAALGNKGGAYQESMLAARRAYDSASSRLGELRSQLRELQKKPISRPRVSDMARLQKEIRALEAQVPRLRSHWEKTTADLNKYIKRLEVEYPTGSRGSPRGGRTSVLVKGTRDYSPALSRELKLTGKTAALPKGGGVAVPAFRPGQKAATVQAYSTKRIPGSSGELKPVSAAAIRELVTTEAQGKGLTDQQINELVQSYTETSPLELTATDTMTAAEVQAEIKAAIKEDIAAKTGTAPAEAAASKPDTKSATKTKTETPVKPPAPPSPKLTPKPPVPLPRNSDKETVWSKEDIESAIAIPDGFVVHAIRSPYRRGIDEKTFHKSRLPAGLKVLENVSGPGSAKQGIVVKGKNIPPRTTLDVGNQDALIRRGRGGRLKISYTLDRGNRTRSQLTVKRGVNISRKKGRVYHTRAGGDTIISRRGLRGV